MQMGWQCTFNPPWVWQAHFACIAVMSKFEMLSLLLWNETVHVRERETGVINETLSKEHLLLYSLLAELYSRAKVDLQLTKRFIRLAPRQIFLSDRFQTY